jgi:hypothetical protein
MKAWIAAALLAQLVPASALADCTDDTCHALQAILQARSKNFSPFKGKAGHDPRGDALWEGTQAIPGLIDYCYLYARGENNRYEYRCDASGLGEKGFVSLDKAREIADRAKAALQAADAKLVWFVDPTALDLANVNGFEGSQAWYGGYSKDKLFAKVAIVGSAATDTTVSVNVFAKFLKRRDVR